MRSVSDYPFTTILKQEYGYKQIDDYENKLSLLKPSVQN